MADSRLLSASAWMAAGTIVSRATGLVRAVLIVAVLGTALNADVFTGANTIPNALYILVAGGIFNVVLVPQLVRTMRRDPDGGEAYANRIVTLGLLVLSVATVVLIALVPVLMRLGFDGRLFEPELAPARQSAEMLMRFCLPQVFFYGAFVLVGQILNARGRFGPMMWAPIANNVVSCAVLGLYVLLFGTSAGADGFSTGQELLLGLGSTLGIAIQCAILIPFLRAAGFSYRPRFDFRGVGLRHTATLGMWTFFFIVVNQIAFFAIQRIATGSTVDAALDGGETAGSTVYQFAFLVSQVPHGVITVSVVTAAIPLFSQLAADHLWPQMRDEVAASLRIVLVAIAPIAVAIACLGQALATLTTSWGGIAGDSEAIGHTIMAFAPGMVFFTVHYLMLRGFYASEDTRTPFFIQIGLSATNITFAVIFTSLVETGLVAAMLALAYGAAYLIGSALSAGILSRRIGRVFDGSMWIYLVRLFVACAVAAAALVGGQLALGRSDLGDDTALTALLSLVVIGPIGAGAYVLAAKLLKVDEVSMILRTLSRRRAA